MRISHKITTEEKVAKSIGDILADLRLDLEMVGKYLARQQPNVVYNRLQVISESAEFEKGIQNGQHNQYTLF